MSRKAPYVKLSMGPASPMKRRSPILGGTVVADYVDGKDHQRYIVVECATDVAPKPVRKQKAKAATAEPEP